MTLTEKLAMGDTPLINVLVCSNINCSTCKFKPEEGCFGKADDGFVCEKTNKFCSLPAINLCFEWQEGRKEEANE